MCLDERSREWLAGVLADPERLARQFHDLYEGLAPRHVYRTRAASAGPWEDVPPANRSLMIAVCREIARQALQERSANDD